MLSTPSSVAPAAKPPEEEIVLSTPSTLRPATKLKEEEMVLSTGLQGQTDAFLKTSTSKVDSGAAACKEACGSTNEHYDSEVQRRPGDSECAKVKNCAMGCNDGRKEAELSNILSKEELAFCLSFLPHAEREEWCRKYW